MYIGDTNNHRVQKYFEGASIGTTVAGQSGSAGGFSNYLNSPRGVVVDSSTNIYVADTSNSRVQFWASSATSGTTPTASTSKTEIQSLSSICFECTDEV
jgi:hypothetical protein